MLAIFNAREDQRELEQEKWEQEQTKKQAQEQGKTVPGIRKTGFMYYEIPTIRSSPHEEAQGVVAGEKEQA